MNFTKQLLSYRKVILILLVIILFVNWYNYRGVYIFLKKIDNYPLVVDFFSPFIDYQTIEVVLIKGGAFLLLSIFNAFLSISIVFVYFKGARQITKISSMILLTFICASVLIEVIAFYANIDYLFATTRYAMEILPSPLVEASLIPLMKLYQQSQQTQNV